MELQKKKRKICFIITSKIHYSRSKLILQELKKREDIELSIVVGASAILSRYGDVLNIMEADGFKCNNRITMTVEGGNTVAMAKTAGIGIIEFANVFENIKPDIVIARGDRYEVLSAVIAAAYLNIAVAHIEGGDVSGTIDESVRHAITKLSHIHFCTNQKAKERVIMMGENPNYVFDFGCPEVELVAKNNYFVSNDLINHLGVGDVVDVNNLFLLVMQHPVSTEINLNKDNVEQTIWAVHEIGIPTIWFWPNVDAGTDDISKGIRSFREKYNPVNIRFLKYLPSDQFIGLLKKASCLVGNSSAGIKEASYLGLPVVNIGTRQNNRTRWPGIIDVSYNKNDIKEAITAQLDHGPYKSSDIYYKENSANNIVNVLSSIELYSQKKFFDNCSNKNNTINYESE